MKFLVVLSVAVACVVADVSHLEKVAEVLRADFDSSPEGSFNYGYETSNGIAAQAQGSIKNPANENAAVVIQGAYKYISPDGTPVEVSYIADENGYQPSSAFLPTPHPIPEAIARSLAYIAAHPPATEYARAAVKPSYAVPAAILG